MKSKTMWAAVCAIALVAGSAVSYVMATDGIGSIPAGDGDESGYAGNATVTPDEAKAIAENATAGTAISVGLENENGYLVYGVIVVNQTGRYDVKVDAGNGAVLNVENDDGAEEGAGGEGADEPENSGGTESNDLNEDGAVPGAGIQDDGAVNDHEFDGDEEGDH